MKVCDKCKSARELDTIKIRTKTYELCVDCSQRIIDWIGKEESKTIIDRVLGRN